MKTILILVALACVLAVGAAHPKQAEAPRQFTLFFYEPVTMFSVRDGAGSKAYWDAWYGYIGGLQSSGKMTGGSALTAPGAGRVLDQSGTKIAGTDKLALSGYVTINADSLEAALVTAKKSPAIVEGGRVEVRPLLPMASKPGGAK